MASQPPRRLALTRQQIARIVGNDFEAIRAFEKLLAIGEETPDNTALLEELATLAASAPPAAPQTSRPAIDVIEWHLLPAYVPTRARMGWEPVSDTLQLGIGTAGVMARYGLDLLTPVYNGSGGAITRGQVLRFTGATDGVLNVSTYLADGSQAAQTVVGVAAQSLAAGASGYALAYGAVGSLDTSAYSAGNVLYASDTVSGAFTTTPPVGPSLAVFCGVVLTVSSTEGRIFIRLTGA